MGGTCPKVVGMESERSSQQSKGWCRSWVRWCRLGTLLPGGTAAPCWGQALNPQQWWEMAEGKALGQGTYRVWRWEWGTWGALRDWVYTRLNLGGQLSLT